MLWAIWCHDAEGSGEVRSRVGREHSEHLTNASVHIVIAGPLIGDASDGSVGSLVVVEADNRAEVEEFVSRDPFKVEGVWRSVEIAAFRMSRVNI